MPYVGNTNEVADKAITNKTYESLRQSQLYFTTQNAWTAPSAQEYVKKLFAEAPKAQQDVQGSLAVVTGVTIGGAGYYMAEELAIAGVHVMLMGRSESKLKEAIESIKKTAKTRGVAEVTLYETKFDLDDLKSAEAASQACATVASEKYGGKLHILINNAGGSIPRYGTTAQGIEVNTGRNTIAPICLTESLLPMLKNAATSSYKPRVHMVASLGQCIGIDVIPERLLEVPEEGGAPQGVCNSKENPVYPAGSCGSSGEMMGGVGQYCRAKYGLVCCAKAMQEEHPTINFTSCQPGSIASNFSAELGLAGAIYYTGFYLFQFSPSQGARAALRAALDPDCNMAEGLQGAYLHCDGNPWPPADPLVKDQKTGETYTLEAFSRAYAKAARGLIEKLLK